MSARGAAAGSRSRSTLAHGLLLLVVVVWGTTFALVKGALNDATPLLFNQVRMLLAAAVLLAIYGRQLRRASRSTWIAGSVAGLLLALGYELQTAGLARTTAAKSAFLTGMVVILVPLLGSLPFLRAPGTASLRWPALVGAGLAFSGIVLLTTPAGTKPGTILAALSTGDLLSLACALAFALHLLSLARFTHQAPAAQLATLQITVAALLMSIATPLLEHPRMTLTPRLLITWLVTAVFATAAAFLIQTWAQQHLPAGHTALILALEPAFAWLTSLLLMHEHLSRRSATGAGLILAALLVSEGFSGTPIAAEPEANLPGTAPDEQQSR